MGNVSLYLDRRFEKLCDASILRVFLEISKEKSISIYFYEKLMPSSTLDRFDRRKV